MAVIKTANTTGKYHDLNSYHNIISYITESDKIIHGYIGYNHLDSYNPAGSMEAVAKKFSREKGVHVRHFILAFQPSEPVTPEIANLIGMEIINYLGQQFQAIYAVHEDKQHLHIHIAINAVSYVDGHKYRGTHDVFNRFRDAIKRILRKYNLFALNYVSNKPQPDSY